MKKKDIVLGLEAREKMNSVAFQIEGILGKTLGPGGRNYLTPQGITNDGRTILSHIRYDDECEDNIALSLAEAAIRTDREVGDGTTTATVFSTALLQSVLEQVPDADNPAYSKMSVMELSAQLEEEKDKAIGILNTFVQPVKDKKVLQDVAMTSMENKEAADIIAGVIWEAGKDSYTVVEEGFTGKIEKDYVEGVKYPLSIAAPGMANNPRKESEYRNAMVLVANHVFETYAEITPFMMKLTQIEAGKRPNALLIVGKQFSVSFVAAITNVVRQSNFPIVLVSNPYLSDDEFLDIGAFCGAVVINTTPKGGAKITTAEVQHTGFVEKFIAKTDTVFVKGRGTEMMVEGKSVLARHVERLTEESSKEDNPDKRKSLDHRIAALSGGIATIYVDAKTAVERFYLKLKAIDAVNACKAALEGGVVMGGGKTMERIADEMPGTLIESALRKPGSRIQQNMGKIFEVGEDVLDPYLVTKAVIENGVSVVKTLLTVEGVIADHPESLVEQLKTGLSQ